MAVSMARGNINRFPEEECLLADTVVSVCKTSHGERPRDEQVFSIFENIRYCRAKAQEANMFQQNKFILFQ
jgi:hypothetical protein